MNGRMHNKQLSAFAVAGLCAVLWTGSQARSQQGGALTSVQEAEETFQARCSTCHAEHGEGSEVGASLNVPDLRSAAVQRNGDEVLREVIKHGKGNMPAFGRDFTDPQIDRILQLVRGFAANSNQQAQGQPLAR